METKFTYIQFYLLFLLTLFSLKNVSAQTPESCNCTIDTLGLKSYINSLPNYDENNPLKFDVQNANSKFAVLRGAIGSTTPNVVQNFINNYPNVTTLVLLQIPGSEDDTANLQAAQLLKNRGYTTYLPSVNAYSKEAFIASGGTDLILAGNRRVIDVGAEVGVHSWSDGSNSATNYPVGHSNHQPYIDYYVAMGFTIAEAEAFYYFTINAAPENSIHNMTEAEIEQYKLRTCKYNCPSDTIAPTAPSNLAASGTTQTNTNLSWTASSDNVGVTGYDIYREASLIGTVTGTTYQVSGLTANTTYTFSVRAKDDAGNVSVASNAINVTTSGASDTSAPTAPANLTASGTTQTSTNLSWTASTDNVAVTSYDIYRGNTLLGSVATTNYQVTGLTASTAYTFSVRAKDEAGNISVSSNTVNVTTSSVAVNYCASKGNNVNYEYIDNVAIGGISNATGANGGYGDFTSQTGNLSVGNNTIILSAGFASSSYTEHWRVWIDFNNDGDFSDSGERVVSGSSSSAGNLSYTFNVPSSALGTTTRMRVSMKHEGGANPCQTFAYGEVEDYTVSIGGASSQRINTSAHVQVDGELGNEPAIFDALIFPNPSSNAIQIRLKDRREASYRIVNFLGQVVKHGVVDNNEINISKLNSDIYIIEVNDGVRSFTKKIIKK